MNRWPVLIRMLLLGMLLTASVARVPTPALAAQSSDVDPASYVSELSGYQVDVSDDNFEIYNAELQTYRNGQGEIIEIASNTAYVQIAFFDDTDTNQETLDIYNEAFTGDVDDFEVLDEGENRDTVFTYAVATYNGVEFYYYLSVTEDVEGNVDLLQRIYATDATFFDDFAAAQDAISIERDGFLEDVDVRDLEDLAGGSTRDEPQPEPTATEEAAPTEDASTEPVPTLDPDTSAVRDLVVVDAQMVSTSEVTVSEGSAELPSYEEIPLGYGNAEVTILLLMRPESPEATLDLILSIFTPEGGSLDNVGTDATRSAAWSLDRVDQNGTPYLLYVEVRNDRFQQFHYAEIIAAPATEFQDAVQVFHDNVQVAGVPMFADADAETLGWLLDGGGAPDSRDDSGDQTQVDDKSDTRGSDEQDSGGLDLESQGLTSDTTYESPQFGVEVEWDDAAWTADTEWELTAVSDTETGIDSVILIWNGGDASIMVQVMETDGEEPADFVDAWESDDYVAENVHEDAEVLLSDSSMRRGAVMYRTYNADGTELVYSQEVIALDDNLVAIVSLFAVPEDISDAYADAEDLLTVDGQDAAGTFTAREVERAIEP